ncbi:MAG: hypothetical protein K8R69_12140 [Deltaproteobacteria bacterium]|nr:hypothetical protein [Deltaproteobacteria bacterium]
MTEHCDLKEPAIRPDQRLQEDLGLDSLGLLAMAVEVENCFQIHLNEDPNQPPQTLGELVELISKRIEQTGPENEK